MGSKNDKIKWRNIHKKIYGDIMQDMFKVKCVNCNKEEWHIVMQEKWVCEECMEKERIQIPSYFDEMRGEF